MIKRIILIIAFLLMGIIEISLIKVLPSPLNFIPLFILPGIFFIQQKKQRLGIIWILGVGLFYDFFYPISTTSPELIKYSLVAILLIVVFRYFFSTKSFYSLIGGGLLTAVFLSLYDLTYLAIISFWNHIDVSGPVVDELVSIPWVVIYTLIGLTILVFADSRFRPYHRS